jgi:pimeloyl-ACP methyl ester carboxylesterase
LDVAYSTVAGTRIRHADTGDGAEPAIVLTSPWPESVYAFVPIWRKLSERRRLVAVDLPGFGGSELRAELMSPSAMGGFLAALIEAFDLGTAHLVAPDVGTAAALFTAADRPELLSSVIVGSGGAAVPIQLHGPLEEWVLAPDIERFRDVDPAAIVEAALATIEGYTPAPAIREDYLASYAGDRFVESMRYARTYPVELPRLAALLPEIETPVLIIAGRQDRVVPLANAEFLDTRLPSSTMVTVDAGHFVWEEAPDKSGSLVADFVSGGSRDEVRARPGPARDDGGVDDGDMSEGNGSIEALA